MFLALPQYCVEFFASENLAEDGAVNPVGGCVAQFHGMFLRSFVNTLITVTQSGRQNHYTIVKGYADKT
jgi:hypothetical protein